MNSLETSVTPAATNLLGKPELLNLTTHQCNHVVGPLQAFLAKHRPYVAQVLCGIGSGPWDKQDIRKMESLLIREIEEPAQVRDCLQVLRKACAFYMLQQRQNLVLPRIPVLTLEPKNPFRAQLHLDLQRYTAWKDRLKSWLEESETETLSAARNDGSLSTIIPVLVSAILHGGLCNWASVVALVRAIPNLDRRVVLTAERIHVDLSLSWRGIPGMENRRWQPDALTATLLARVPTSAVAELLAPTEALDRPTGNLENPKHLAATGGNSRSLAPDDRTLKKRITELLLYSLQQISTEERRRIGGMSTLLRASQTCAHLSLPGILASYASRNLVSHSLHRRALQRTSKSTWIAGVDSPAQSYEPDKGHPRLEAPIEDLEFDWARRLRESMQGTDSNQARARLARLGSEGKASAFLRSMVDFADSLLAVPSVSGKLRPVRTARNLVLLVAKALGCFAEDEDIDALSSEALDLLYVQAVESTGAPGEENSARANLCSALYEFHLYMMACHGKDPLEGQSKHLLHVRPEMAAVDANLLTLEGYQDVLERIQTEWPLVDDPQRKRIARILVILGFRCGLRRREALHMLVQDLLLDGPAELLIRPSEIRKLKSDNALRRLPLAVLLTEEELLEIISWHKFRVDQQGAKPRGCLFGNKLENLDVIPQSIFEQINLILARATRDSTLHFHHLRHSFATWTFLRLMLAELEPTPDPFPDLEATTIWLRQSPSFRKALYGNSHLTRKHGYLLAALLGHGSPATSLEHYVHLLDWLLAIHLERSPALCPDKRLVDVASGKSRNTLRQWTKLGSRMAIPLQLWRKRMASHSGTRIQSLPPDFNSPMSTAALDAQPIWIHQTWQFLYTMETALRPLEEIARSLHLDEKQAQSIWIRGRELRDMRSGKRPRHKMETRIPDRQSPQTKQILACPRQPLYGPDKEILRMHSAILEIVAEKQPAITSKALRMYAHGVWSSENFLVFHDPAKDFSEARTYIDFLVLLGILRKDILYVSFEPTQRSAHRAEWRKLLGLNQRDHFVTRIPPNKNSRGSFSWLGIEPQFNLGPAANQAKNPGSLGFRYLMLMGYLRFSSE